MMVISQGLGLKVLAPSLDEPVVLSAPNSMAPALSNCAAGGFKLVYPPWLAVRRRFLQDACDAISLPVLAV